MLIVAVTVASSCGSVGTAAAPAVERKVVPAASSTSVPSSTSLPSSTSGPESDEVTDAPAIRPASSGTGQTASRRLAGDGTPTFSGDFADPFLLAEGDDFFAYASNTLAFNIPVMVARGDGRGELLGDALPALPAWSERFYVWAPSVTKIDDQYVMHYATRNSATSRQCLSVAVSIWPEGPFVDDSSEPLFCASELGGAIDPSVVESGGDLWLLWKSDGNCCGLPTVIFAQLLTGDGRNVAGEPVALIANDLSWEHDVVEAPSMIKHNGVFHLFYSANRWDTHAYGVGHAVCVAVIGPCVKDPQPWLADTEATSGPGGLEATSVDGLGVDLVVYHGWTGDEIGYPAGNRSLYVRRLRWENGSPTLDRG